MSDKHRSTKLAYTLDEAAAATGLSKTHPRKQMRDGRLLWAW